MNITIFLHIILFTTFCFNVIHSNVVDVECQCSCDLPAIQTIYESFQLNSIKLETNICQTSLCVDVCQETYPIFRLRNGRMKGKCIQLTG